MLHNLFFAVRPDAPTAEDITDLTDWQRRRHGLSGRPTTRGRQHISLNYLGCAFDPPRRLIARAEEVASTVAMRPFVVALDRVVSFQNNAGLRPRVLVGEDGVIGVHALHSVIHQGLADAFVVRRAVPALNPHLTLLRDRLTAPEDPITPVRWWVREFVLIDSLYGESRHELLGRWPLLG